MKKKITFYGMMILMAVSSMIKAQPYTIYASGFSNLIGISRDTSGNIFVAEAGSGNNDAKISLITSGAIVYPLITGLPSFLDTAVHEVSGAWRAQRLPNNKLMVIVGGGVDINAGSILFFNISSFVPGTSLPLTVGDADSILHVSNYIFSQGILDSDPYSTAFGSDGALYIADAAANAIVRYDFGTQIFSILDSLPGFPNPFGGLPPKIDYVPTRIINNPAGGFFMCNLGGFFPSLGRIITVNESGSIAVIDSGFTSLVDMQYDWVTGDKYAMQFSEFDSSFHPIMGSAKIFRIDPSGNSTMVHTGFGPSAGFVLDGLGGAYVTEIITGNVLYISDINSVKQITENFGFAITSYPNPFTSSINLSMNSDENAKADLVIKNVLGQEIYSSVVNLNKGENRITWNGKSNSGINVSAGNYFVTVKTTSKSTSVKILKQ